MLPSLSKHFIKAMLAPIQRGPTPEEVHAVMPRKPMSTEAKTEWITITLPRLMKREKIKMDQRMGTSNIIP